MPFHAEAPTPARRLSPEPHALRWVATLRRHAARLALAGLLAALPAAAHAQIYVDGGNPACTNAGPGTEAVPYCTITAAAAAHGGPGALIRVKPGVYREQVNIPASGAAGNPFRLETTAAGVIVDGADDFNLPGAWVFAIGTAWKAASVTWDPKQVFVDGARLVRSAVPPASLGAGEFTWVSGEGLYVNLGGDNPGGHVTFVGRRSHGFNMFNKSWVRIDGFEVTRAEDRGVHVQNGCADLTLTGLTITFSKSYGLQSINGQRLTIRNNTVSGGEFHGIGLTAGASACTLRNNESFNNAQPGVRIANGIYLYGSPGNVLFGNRVHDNQDSGMQIQSGSNNCISYNNRSWNNGDHGYDMLGATGTIRYNDLAFGNYKDGFSVEGGATSTTLLNCIAIDNGLTTDEFGLYVDAASVAGLVSDYNVFWNSTSQPPIKFNGVEYPGIAGYKAASGQDANSLQVDPGFLDAAAGDFRVGPGSPVIDSGTSAGVQWPALDADGQARIDVPGMPNVGAGPVPFGDRGPIEYKPGPPPVASLTVTPTTGNSPLLVQCDASGSMGSPIPIVSYTFSFGNGATQGPQPGSSASHLLTPGTYTVGVTVTNADGLTHNANRQVVVAATGPGPNLILNPSFETNLNGWTPLSGASLMAIAGGFDGATALRVTGPANLDDFGVGDAPDWVDPTAGAGALYRFRAWVRSASGTGAARLRVREIEPDASFAGPAAFSSDVALSPVWQLIELNYGCVAAGNHIDLRVLSTPTAPSQQFEVDNLSAHLATSTVAVGDGPPLRFSPAIAPNPMAERGAIRFGLPRGGALVAEIFDLGGRRVRTLVRDAAAAPGNYEIAIDGRRDDGGRMGPGVYFYRVQSPSGTATGRFLIVR